jgi:hypothetical protein
LSRSALWLAIPRGWCLDSNRLRDAMADFAWVDYLVVITLAP